MNVWQVDYKEPLKEEFFEVAQHIYQDDPQWLGECKSTTCWQFGDSNPYLNQITTKIWGVENDARVSGFFNPSLRINGEPAAFFGFFESINDPNICMHLFSLFETWAKKQGAVNVYGPINFTTYGSYRIQIGEKQDRIPFWGEPYNPQYYRKLLEHSGYKLKQDYFSMFGNEYHLDTYAQATNLLQENISRLGITSHALTPDLWIERQDEIYSIFSALWEQNFGFVPIDQKTFKIFFSRQTAEKLDPNTSIALIDSDNKIAGYFAVYPDYGPALAQGNPDKIDHRQLNYNKAFPLLSNPNILLKTGCVHPKYRQQKLFTTLSVFACDKAREYGYHAPVGCLVRSDNHSRHMAEYAQRLNPKAKTTFQYYGLFTKKI